MNPTSEIIIRRIQSKYDQILQLYQGVPLAALWEPALPGGLSVKDSLAHIAAWAWRCAFLLGQARQMDALLRASPDREALNQEFYQERRAWDWTRVELDFRRSHSALFDAIQLLPPEQLNNPIVQRTIARETWEHYDQHLPDLERWRAQLMSEQILMTYEEQAAKNYLAK